MKLLTIALCIMTIALQIGCVKQQQAQQPVNESENLALKLLHKVPKRPDFLWTQVEMEQYVEYKVKWMRLAGRMYLLPICEYEGQHECLTKETQRRLGKAIIEAQQ